MGKEIFLQKVSSYFAWCFYNDRTELVKRLNGFDETIFMYGEGIDLCYRIIKQGYKNIYGGTCVIIHFEGEARIAIQKKHYYAFFAAMKIYIDKHFSAGNVLFKAILTGGIAAAKMFHKTNKKATKKGASMTPLSLVLKWQWTQ